MKKKTSLPQTLEKFIGRPIAAIAVAAWVIQSILEFSPFNYPLSPNAANGSIVPYPIKGRIVYLTKLQYEALYYLFWTTIISLAIALIVFAINKMIELKQSS